MKIKRLLFVLFLVVSGSIAHASAKDDTRSDVWLDAKITTTYALNEHLNPFDISVDVKDGIAVLGGEVDSSVEKALAVEIARGMEGIKQVEDNIRISPSSGNREPSGFMRAVSDASMAARVKTNLLLNKETSAMDIDVDADNGVVTLNGNVSSEAEKDLAVTLAENTSGVYRVKDKLSVSNQAGLSEKVAQAAEQAGSEMSDGWITAKIKSRLLFDRHTDGLDISVSTQDAVVTLEGKVSDKLEKDYAIQLAKNTVHVKKVVDRLKTEK